MTVHSDHLRQMRKDAGFPSARAAAIAMHVPVATYLQHENGKRACSIAQFERYSIFLSSTPFVARYLRVGGESPDPEGLAATVYDHMNRARHWRDAPQETQDTYRDLLEDVYRAMGINLPHGAFRPLSGQPGAS